MKLKQKVELVQKGDECLLETDACQATLRWTTALDLDLHCYATASENTNDTVPTAPTGILGVLKKVLKLPDANSSALHVFFARRGSRTAAPWIFLDQDAGVGDAGGENEENLYLSDLSKVSTALIVANIYNKPNSNFATADGIVLLQGSDTEVTIPLTASEAGSYCVVAKIDNRSGTPKITNVNKTLRTEPSIADFDRY